MLLVAIILSDTNTALLALHVHYPHHTSKDNVQDSHQMSAIFR
jgi:hypothetical protein